MPPLPSRWLLAALTLASGLAFALCFAPWDFYPLAGVLLVPWAWAVRHRAGSARGALLLGFGLSQAAAWLAFPWIAHSMREFGQIPWPLALLGLFAFGWVCQPQFPLLALWLWRRRRRAMGAREVLGTALAYAALDAWAPKLFEDTLGHAFAPAPWLRQAADLGGTPLLTAVLCAVNLSLLAAVERIRPAPPAPRARRWRGVVAGFVPLLAIAAYGYFRDGQIRAWEEAPTRTVPMAVIQGNIGDFEKIAAEKGVKGAADAVIQTFTGLSRQALAQVPPPVALVWPETAFPSTFRNGVTENEKRIERAMEEFARSHRVPLLFGGYDTAGGRDFNALFHLDAGASPDLQTYRKNILLLFGEYLPGMAAFPFLRRWFPQIANFGRGPGPTVLKLRTPDGALLYGPVICYEILDPEYVRSAWRQGSQLILNITNDSWFGTYAEPWQHLALSVFRSVELRVPQLRATNTGVSALILPSGRIAARTEIGTAEILTAPVPVFAQARTTLRGALGNWFPPVALGVAALLLAPAAWLRRRLYKA